jgi:hypothetical protein
MVDLSEVDCIYLFVTICISRINVSGISIIQDRDGIQESFLFSPLPSLNTGALQSSRKHVRPNR